MPPISACLIVCEKILNEADGVLSAIRIADLYALSAEAKGPESIWFSAIGVAKFDSQDTSDHTGTIRLIRPDGDTNDLHSVTAKLGEMPIKFPGTPRGFNILLSVNLLVKQMGTHVITFAVDDQEVSRVAFTLVRQSAEPHIQEAE